MKNSEIIKELMDWLDRSTSPFRTVDVIKEELDKVGFIEIKQEEKWNLKEGGKYYLVKNNSAIFSFILPAEKEEVNSVKIISAHSDSPSLRLKPNCEIYNDGGLVTLNVEKYGGGILYTWFDRPLSISGRVAVETNDPFKPEILTFDLGRPIATIPHLAIHFNREVNKGNDISVQKDMKPVIGYFSEYEIEEAKKSGGIIKKLIAEHLEVAPNSILASEIILYPYDKSIILGTEKQFIQSSRIDDLSMVYAGLRALLDESHHSSKDLRILAVFDNEETGSATKQGAASPILRDVIERINQATGGDQETLIRNISSGFMISADDAHAWHPNYSEKYDPTNKPMIGRGPVIKINSNGKYMTDTFGAAVFRKLCEIANVSYQIFVNHSDIAGGSTLGNISTSQMDINGVDVGAAIWGMHSIQETASVSDHIDFIKVFKEFWH